MANAHTPNAVTGRFAAWIKSPTPYLALVGYGLFLFGWYLLVDVFAVGRFSRMPGLTSVFHEWVSVDPAYGVSIHTPIYYQHIWTSLERVGIAFALARRWACRSASCWGGHRR